MLHSESPALGRQATALRELLFKAYGGFADKRRTRVDRDASFAVDGRDEGDYAADGSFYTWFCSIHVRVISGTAVKVSLFGNIPTSPRIQSWIKTHGASYVTDLNSSMEFQVDRDDQQTLRYLAQAMRAIVATGAPRYEVKSYKYVCPRTATSLERLADVLDSAWR